jgi:hypothetical protein
MRLKTVATLAIIGTIFFSPDGLGENSIWIKYRSTPVDVDSDRFESFDTSKSSFVTNARYDAKGRYLILGLGGVNYHYCGLPREAWDALKGAESIGRFYHAQIKGNYDCRLGGVPEYP